MGVDSEEVDRVDRENAPFGKTIESKPISAAFDENTRVVDSGKTLLQFE